MGALPFFHCLWAMPINIILSGHQLFNSILSKHPSDCTLTNAHDTDINMYAIVIVSFVFELQLAIIDYQAKLSHLMHGKSDLDAYIWMYLM